MRKVHVLPGRVRALVAAVSVFALLHFAGTAASAQSADVLKDVTVPEIKNIEAEKAARSPSQQKIGSQLLDAMKQQANGQVPLSVPGLRINQVGTFKKGALVDIDASVTQPLLESIKKAGGTIVNFHESERAVRAYIPLENMESIASRPEINSINPAVRATTNAIRSRSEGIKAHGADHAATAFRVTGSGIKVGVISDSIDNGQGALKAAFASGAMSKRTLTWLEEQEGEGSGEGLAMAEIIHAIAPGASIVFATGNNGAAQMAANIRALQKAGCRIIVDDLTYFNESPFQDGPIARAVNDVTSAGVLYFSSARNSGSKKHGTSGTWEGDFRDGGLATGEVAGNGSHRIHTFADGVTANKVVRASKDRVDLFWADPLGKSTNDYNLYVIDSEGHVVRSSTTSHTGTQDPYQSVSGLIAGESIIVTKSESAADLFIHLDAGRAILSVTTDGNVRGHNASGARNAFSVAATGVPNPPGMFIGGPNVAVEKFSSDGPRRLFFDPNGVPHTPGNFSSKGGLLLQKPDISAANGVSTSFPKGSGLNPFYGTSAAAPHAAAIAALLLSYSPKLTPTDVTDLLMSSAMPIDGGGRNNNAGVGIVMPYSALLVACQKVGKTTCPSPIVHTTKGEQQAGGASDTSIGSRKVQATTPKRRQ